MPKVKCDVVADNYLLGWNFLIAARSSLELTADVEQFLREMTKQMKLLESRFRQQVIRQQPTEHFADEDEIAEAVVHPQMKQQKLGHACRAVGDDGGAFVVVADVDVGPERDDAEKMTTDNSAD